MAKVIGIGGIFFKSSDWEKLSAWYRDVLGIEFRDWGGAVFTPDMLADASGPATVLAGFANDTGYFAPSTMNYMLNFMVDDLSAVLERCRSHGIEPTNVMMDEPNGRFAHILDPEGRKLELWQPRAMQ